MECFNHFTVLNDEYDDDNDDINDNVNARYDNDVYSGKTRQNQKRRHRRGGKKDTLCRSNKNKVKIGFNNVNRLRPKITEIGKLLKAEEIDVFGVAESFLQDIECVNVDNYRWIGKNRTHKGGGGVGFFISNKTCVIDDNVFDSSDDNYERLWIKVSFDMDKHMYIAVSYFPVEGVNADLTDELYNQLLSEIIIIQNSDVDPNILIMGDMNGRIGNRIYCGDPVLNSNGERLLNFEQDSDLEIVNCNRLCEGKFTWARGNLKSTIDYMLCSNYCMNRVCGMLVDEERTYGLGSDHNVLLLTLKVKRYHSNNKDTKSKRIIWDINHDTNYTDYQTNLNFDFNNWDIDSFVDPDSLWNSWKDKLLSSAHEGLGTKEIKGNYNSWFDKGIDNAINDRRKAARDHRKWIKGEKNDMDFGDELWKSYQDKRTHVKNLIKSKRMEMRVNKSIDVAKKGGPACKDFWKVLKQNDNTCNPQVHCIKSPQSNELIFGKDKLNQTIRQYWNTLGKMHMNMNGDVTNGSHDNNHRVKLVNNKVNSIRCQPDSDNNNVTNETLSDIDISMDIVIEAINLAKNNKSPGLDGITNELIKNGGVSLHKSMYNMFKKLISFEKIPKEWNRSIIIPIFKKGDRKDLNNYRGISLTSCVSKIFNRIIALTISKFLENGNTLSEVQGGFRPSYRTEDHIFNLKTIASCRLAEGKKTFMAFLDFRKAFDTVWREGLLLAAWNSGLRGRIWRLIDALYDNVQAQVKFGDIETDFFDVSVGVKQGCVLSPVLFSIFINEFTKVLKKHDIGVRIHNVCVGSLFWADDIVLIANDESELNIMLSLAAEFATNWQLQFNHSKSNVLIVGQRINNTKLWKLGNKQISEVDSYKYLGIHFSRNLHDHCHVQEVIKKGNRLISYIKSIINNLDNFDRVNYGNVLWRTIALPSINYACSVWFPGSQADIDKIENLQLQMARYILKAPRYTPRAALYGDLGWVPIATLQDGHRTKFFARVINLEAHRWPKFLLNTMLSLDINPCKLRYKFMYHIINVLDKCSVSNNIIYCAKTGRSPDNPHWVNSIKSTLSNIFVSNWEDDIASKSSLHDYQRIKFTPGMENYLLDNSDFYGASLKFKARSNTLPLESKVSKWSSNNDGICKICNNGVEDLKHFLFTCTSLNDIRSFEYVALEKRLMDSNNIDVWIAFISGDLDIKYAFMLGSSCTKDITGSRRIKCNINIYYDIFDTFSKSYIKRAWKARSVLLNTTI